MTAGKEFLTQDKKVEVCLADEFRLFIDGYPHTLSLSSNGKGGVIPTLTNDLTHEIVKHFRIKG